MIIWIPWLSFVVGFSVALSVRAQLRRGWQAWREAYLPGLLLFEGFVLLPVAAYLVFRYPAWSFLYQAPAGDGYGLWSFGLLVISLLLAVAGFALTGWLLRRQAAAALWGVGVLAVAVLAIACVLFGDRMIRISEDLDYQAAPRIFATGAGPLLAFVIPVILGGWSFLLVLFSLEGNRMRRVAGPETEPRGPFPTPNSPISEPDRPASLPKAPA